MTDFTEYDAHIERSADRWLSELIEAARQPSVSATGEGIDVMAERVADRLRQAGAEVVIAPSGVSHPAVIGGLGGGRRSLLLYDHYDVQPPGDLAAWSSPPWQPTVRGGAIYGRGIADDKGELFARIQAAEAYRTAFGDLPLGVVFLIEGAHEIGSPGLAEIVAGNRERLRADGCLSEGTGRDEGGRFTLHLGCRGFVSLELSVRIHERPVASMYGGLLPSAARRLADALTCCVGSRGEVLVEGVAERVVGPSQADLRLLEQLPWDEEAVRTNLGLADGVEFVGGLTGQRLLRRYLLEPFGVICSVTAGDPAWGLVVPGEASARLDVRLVPDLEPFEVAELVRRHLDARRFADVSVKVLGGVAPDRCPTDAPIVAAALAAAREVEGSDPVVFPIMPAYSASRVFSKALGVRVLFAGAVTNARSNLHVPDENIVVAEYLAYIRFIGRFLARFAAS